MKVTGLAFSDDMTARVGHLERACPGIPYPGIPRWARAVARVSSRSEHWQRMTMRGIEQIPWLYDLLMHLAPGVERWRGKLVAGARGRVLEVGCGTGRTLPGYREDVELFALDPNFDVLPRACRRCGDARFLCASAEFLPFADDSFDCVVSSLVFCSVPDVDRGLRELKRVLRPEGRLLMLEHVQARSKFGARFLDWIQPAWTRITGGCHPNRDTVAAVERAGFVIEADSLRVRGLMRRFTARLAD